MLSFVSWETLSRKKKSFHGGKSYFATQAIIKWDKTEEGKRRVTVINDRVDTNDDYCKHDEK